MIFALFDYFHYCRRSGRYSRKFPRNLMNVAWEGEIPKQIFGLVDDGDTLAFQRFNSVASWAIMYGTSSHVSHVGIYCKGQKVAHVTTKGTKIEPLSNIYDKDLRILPIKLKTNKITDTPTEKIMESQAGRPYDWLGVFAKGIKILFARNWHHFRWKFFIDLSIILFLLDISFLYLFGRPFMSWLIVPYFSIIIFNMILWRFKPLQPDNENGTPADIILYVMKYDGVLVGDAYSVRDQDHGFPIYRASKSDEERMK